MAEDSRRKRLSQRIFDRASNFLSGGNNPPKPNVDDVLDGDAEPVPLERTRSEASIRQSLKVKFREVKQAGVARSRSLSLRLPKRVESEPPLKRERPARRRPLSEIHEGRPVLHHANTLPNERHEAVDDVVVGPGLNSARRDHDAEPSSLSSSSPTRMEQTKVARNASSMADLSIAVPLMLQEGTPMTKVSAKKQKRYLFRLDPDQGQILWESKKQRIIPIEAIKELRTCSDAKYYREQFQLAMEYEDRWLTLVYVLDGQYKTLHLVAPTTDVFRAWDGTLRRLHAVRQALMSGLGHVEMRQTLWERQYWKGADQVADQRLDFWEVERLCKRLNINSPTEQLKRLFKEADRNNRGYLDFPDFQRFVRMLKARPELDQLYRKICDGAAFDFNAFTKFMQHSQKSSLSEHELRRIFTKYVSTPTDPRTPPSTSASLPAVDGVLPTPKDVPLKDAGAPSPPEQIEASTSSPAPTDAASELTAVQSAETSSYGEPALSPDAAGHASSSTGAHEGDTAAPASTPALSTPSSKGNSCLADGSAAPGRVPVSVDCAKSGYSSIRTAPAASTPSDAATSHAEVDTSGEVSSAPADTAPTPSSPKSTPNGSATPAAPVLPPVKPSPPTTTTSSDDALWTLEGFTAFLLSTDNSAFADQHGKIYHDMSRPLSEYFISSSHNTYLVGHQLVGVSTIEGYIRALLHGCRSVELDIYDGDTEPMIFHGKTFTSKVSVREVCTAIAKYAFVTSPYPVIISAEIHCGLVQQDMLAHILHDVLGDALVRAPPEGRPKIEVLPSPEDLKGKVLLKAKNLYVSASEGMRSNDVVVDGESSSTETSASDSELVQDVKEEWKKAKTEPVKELKQEFQKARNAIERKVKRHSPSPSLSGPSALVATSTSTATLKPPEPQPSPQPPQSSSPPAPKVKMSLALVALLVYTVGVKCRGLNKKEQYAPEHLFSLSENTANKILKQGMMDLIKHTRTHVVRVYPKGLRLNSTNYEPHRYWSAGAQLVAINWQTFDLGYMINHAMFQRNGRSGYVLKPLALRMADKELLSKRTKHFFEATIISAQQLPRPKDEDGREVIDKSTVDPYVEVSLHIPDWTHSPFLPSEGEAKYSPASAPNASSATSARMVYTRTRAVKNNGFNPVWSETLCLPFDCVGEMLDLVFVRFAVRQERKNDDDGEPLAVYCTSLGSLQEGFRHIPLHDSQLSQYLFSTLFVQINVTNA